MKTKRAQKAPEELYPVIQKWLQFNRRNTVILPGSDCGIERGPEVKTIGRFKLSEIANMDQTPLPFEFNEGKTYAKRGSKTVWVKEQRSGWNKRQATLQLCIHADGKPHTNPLIMFKGSEGLGDARRKAEFKRYAKGVAVIFNPKAYANGKNLKMWARQQYKWGSEFLLSDNEPRLLVLDAFGAHKKKKGTATEEEKQDDDDFVAELKKLNVTVSMIPGGGTGYVQVVDLLVNRLFKDILCEQEEAHYDLHEAEWRAGKFNVGDKRVLITHWVKFAYDEVHRRYGDEIRKAFQQVGLSLNPDGSEDWKLKIRDLPSKLLCPFNR
jgi:hypothetical protein